jgi:hypothetical protein
MIVSERQYTETESGVLVAEASTLGVPPGYEPPPAVTVMFDGTGYVFKRVGVSRDEGDFVYWLYTAGGWDPAIATNLRIYND